MAEINSKYQRRPNWTEEERIFLVEAVNQRSQRLFGKFKGPGTVKGGKLKEEAWEEVTAALNARSSQVKRTVDEARKQYANLKQRAKEKYDAIRRPKTGGGPKPSSPSSAETLILDDMADKPTLKGLSTGVDSEDLYATVGEQSTAAPMTLEQIEPILSQAFLTELNAAADLSSGDISLPGTSTQNPSLPVNVIIDDDGILKCPPKVYHPPVSKPTTKRKVAELEMVTLETERDKFREEIKKLKQETEFYTIRIELSKMKKQKIQLEIEEMKKKSLTENEL